MRGLILALALQTSEPTVAVIVGVDRPPVIMTVREAETLLALEPERSMRAALEIALGTLPPKDVIECVDHQPRCHTIRGRRLPAQGID